MVLQKARAVRPVAVFTMAVGLAVEILAIDFTGVDGPCITWRWSGEAKERVSHVRDGIGAAKFRAGRHWISLAECERV